jgi:hypothetical protein
MPPLTMTASPLMLAAVFPVAQVGFQRETGIDHQMKSYLFLKTDASGVDSRLT